jgi:hypothetical protein
MTKGSKTIHPTALLQLAVCDKTEGGAQGGGGTSSHHALLLHVAHMAHGNLDSCRLLKQVLATSPLIAYCRSDINTKVLHNCGGNGRVVEQNAVM